VVNDVEAVRATIVLAGFWEDWLETHMTLTSFPNRWTRPFLFSCPDESSNKLKDDAATQEDSMPASTRSSHSCVPGLVAIPCRKPIRKEKGPKKLRRASLPGEN
jgi:hypothetical protein